MAPPLRVTQRSVSNVRPWFVSRAAVAAFLLGDIAVQAYLIGAYGSLSGVGERRSV